MTIQRRDFLSSTLGASLLLSAPAVIGKARSRVVVVGGGPGGATVARYLAKDGKGTLDVTLIEPSRTYYTCFFSNLYLGGFKSFDELGHGYQTLASQYGINVLHDLATGIDTDKKTVRTAQGAVIAYDKLILSPGIDFVEGSVPGWDASSYTKMPHAYKGGTQLALLKAQLEAMPKGGTFVMVAPPDPYRCPPGPYERVSMAAHLFKKSNPTAKIIILDPKSKFSKQALFQEGWSNHYKGMIEWLPVEIIGKLERVDPDSLEVFVDGDTFKGDVVNVIPAMKAGRIAEIAGVADDSGWAPVHASDMRSRLQDDIYVLGDAAAQGDMPKSAFSANSQAKVCANAVRGALTGSRIFPARYANTCWSLIDTDDGVKVGASYEPTDEKIATVEGFISRTGEDAALRRKTYQESIGWYNGFTKDVFG